MGAVQKLEFEVGDGVLTIVPAAHFHAVFAEEVNALCCDPATRPDAIAVELGPSTAVAVTNWLKELGIGPRKRKKLPCMLGQVKQNRYLRPSVRVRAHRLQIETGRELHELSGEILEQELGHKSTSLIPLSPTDSIIEALRCACELDIPAYGVDLEDTPSALEHPAVLIPDTTSAEGQVAAYADCNRILATRDSDPETHVRRELAMAARLKTLLGRHRRVLFTCGLAHWLRIVSLLKDSGVRPAKFGIDDEPNILPAELSRVVVHPSIAFQFMDRFPAVARFYERYRRHPLLASTTVSRCDLHVDSLFTAKLRQAVRRLAYANTQSERDDHVTTVDTEYLRDFPRVVRDYCRLRLRDTPDLASTLACARAFLGEDFSKALLDRFIEFPWAKQSDYPDCETLAPSGDQGIQERFRLLEPAGDEERLAKWIRERMLDRGSGGGEGHYQHTWSAWDDLVTAMSDRAVLRSISGSTRVAEPFAGTLQSGIAVKQTVRSYARGEDALYVLTEQSMSGSDLTTFSEGWPVVWLFDNGLCDGSKWQSYLVPISWMTKYAVFPQHFAKRCGDRQSNLAAVLSFGDSAECTDADLNDPGVSLVYLRGLLTFSPVFPTNLQYTRWVEATNYAQNAFFRFTDARGLPDTMAEDITRLFGHPGRDLRWQDEMVGMALPYARSQLTVVVPTGFRLSAKVHRAARKLHKRIAVVDLDSFSADDIERIKNNHSVAGTLDPKDGGTNYVASAEDAMHEDPAKYRSRVRAQWQTFGLNL